ncbi:MAG: hypothetical protein ACI808_003098 [Paraglaciecola sp.]|jgi:hypothetical protein
MKSALTGYKRSLNKGGGPADMWDNKQSPPAAMTVIDG